MNHTRESTSVLPITKLRTDIRTIDKFVRRHSTCVLGRGRMYSTCLRAALAKNFEFAKHAIESPDRDACFSVPMLRGICEDIIVLGALAKHNNSTRDTILSTSMSLSVLERVDTQSVFFQRTRPGQQVLAPTPGSDLHKATLLLTIQREWNNAGRTVGGKKSSPTIRDLAEDAGLSAFYEFVYSLTSDMVHFNPGVLLRSGWGRLPRVTFSPRHFDRYYGAMTKVYSAYLLCVFFETFNRQLRPDERTRRAIASIRAELHGITRWPELVTFEEMDRPVPQPPPSS